MAKTRKTACRYCEGPMHVVEGLIISDGKGVQKTYQGSMCASCGRIYIHTTGAEEQASLTLREQALAEEIAKSEKAFAEERETLLALGRSQSDQITALTHRAEAAEKLAGQRGEMFDQMQQKFVEANAAYQSLRDKKTE